MPPGPAKRISLNGAAGSLVEERAAKKLGISIAKLRQAALKLRAAEVMAQRHGDPI